jgi:hypothetical protein
VAAKAEEGLVAATITRGSRAAVAVATVDVAAAAAAVAVEEEITLRGKLLQE